MDAKESLLTPEQVANILNLHILTVYSYIRKGQLGAVRLGRTYRILPSDLELFVETNRVRSTPLVKKECD